MALSAIPQSVGPSTSSQPPPAVASTTSLEDSTSATLHPPVAPTFGLAASTSGRPQPIVASASGLGASTSNLPQPTVAQTTAQPQAAPVAVPHKQPARSRPSNIPTFNVGARFSASTGRYETKPGRIQKPRGPKPPSRPSSRPPTAKKDQAGSDEAYILVMGPSGSGKTSFINLASDSHLPVSSGLGSCTSEISLSRSFQVDGQHIRLIDTPGFDDSTKSDADVLAHIAEFLVKEYSTGKRIRGILYFHRISDVRIAKKNLVVFQKMCGEHAYANIVVVTTRWNEVNMQTAETRENELRTRPTFFQHVVDAGGKLMRYARTDEGTKKILKHVLTCPPVELAIQRQMVVEKRRLADTDAGMKLHVEKATQIEACKEGLRQLQQEMEVLKETEGLEGGERFSQLQERAERLQEQNQWLMSRQSSSSESWEFVSGEFGSAESLLEEPCPLDDEAEPTMIGGLPVVDGCEKQPGTQNWSEWLYAMLANMFEGFNV